MYSSNDIANTFKMSNSLPCGECKYNHRKLEYSISNINGDCSAFLHMSPLSHESIPEPIHWMVWIHILDVIFLMLFYVVNDRVQERMHEGRCQNCLPITTDFHKSS